MDELDALADADEVREFVEGEALVAIFPLVVNKEDVVKAKALLAHKQEPHSHGTRPHHEPDDLQAIVQLLMSDTW